MKQLLKSGICKALCGAIVLGAMLLTAAKPAQAVIIAAHSRGFGVEAGLSAQVLDVGDFVVEATLDVGPVPAGVEGFAPPPYNESQQAVALDASATVVNLVVGEYNLGAISGTLGATALSNVDGLPGNRLTEATAIVEDLDLGISTLTVLTDVTTLVSLSAAAIDSVARVTGDFGALSLFGDSTLLGLELLIAGSPFDLTAFVDADGKAAPNTVIGGGVLGLTGLTIFLNEQIVAGDGSTFAAITVNAIRLLFEDVASGIVGVGLISGEVTISHSHAQMTAAQDTPGPVGEIPEPGMLLTFAGLFGLFAVTGALRRRRRQMA